MLSQNINSTNGLQRIMKDKEDIYQLTNLVVSTNYIHTHVLYFTLRSGVLL